MSTFNIRPASDADDSRIKDLTRNCEQKGMITFIINRTPRFNTLQRLLDPEAWHLVAEKDGLVIGQVGVVHFPARVVDRACKVGYMLDLKVDRAYRSGLTAYRLIKAAEDHVLQSDADMVIANFLQNNNRSLVFTSGRVGLPSAHHMGTNRIFNIIPIRRMRVNDRYTIGKPTEGDIPALLRLYEKYGSGFDIAPMITEERFRNYLDNINGLSLDNFLVARENGRIVAVTALWDEHPYKSYQVLKLNFSIAVVAKILNFLSHFMKVPHPIMLNEPLRQRSLLLYAHDGSPEALDSLFRHANNISMGSEYTLIMLYAQENDPVFNGMRKFTGVSVRSEMYLFARDKSSIDMLKDNSPRILFDMIMTI